MPGEDFYAGLPLAAQVRKMMDHHAAREVRHISSYEAGILDRAAVRLAAGVDRAQAISDFDTNWRQLGQVYTTAVVSPFPSIGRLEVDSVRVDDALIGPNGLARMLELEVIAVAGATARTAQIGLNALWHHRDHPEADLEEFWSASHYKRGVPVDRAMSEEHNALTNGVLYQPTVVVEQSPPAFVAMADILGQDIPSDWIGLFSHGSSPMEILMVGGALIVVSVAYGASAGLRRSMSPSPDEISRSRDACSASIRVSRMGPKGLPIRVDTKPLVRHVCTMTRSIDPLDPEERPTISVEEAGKILGLSRPTAYAAVHRNEIPTIKIGHRYLVPTAELRRMLRLPELPAASNGAPHGRRPDQPPPSR